MRMTMDDQEREAYREFVRTFCRTIFHMPDYATAEDYRRLLQPLLQDAEALLGSEEIATLQQEK